MTALKIYAEVSANHGGSLDRALAIVDAAAAIGTVRYVPTEAELPMLEVRRVRMQGKC